MSITPESPPLEPGVPARSEPGEEEQQPALDAVRLAIAQRLVTWTLPVMFLGCVASLAVLIMSQASPFRLGSALLWLVTLGISGWFAIQQRWLRSAGLLGIGLALVTGSSTLLNGVHSYGFIGNLVLMALVIPLFGVRWGWLLMTWIAATGGGWLFLDARGWGAAPRAISAMQAFAFTCILALLILAVLAAPTRMLVDALREAHERMVALRRSQREERKAAEALQKSNEQLQQSRRLEALGQLAGGVAHDFNNMLGAIMGATELIALGIDASREPQQRENVELLRDATRRATELTSKLLAFGRRDHFGTVERVDVNETLRALETLARPMLGATIKIVVSTSPQPLWVRVDRAAIEQALFNLVVNARDAMRDGGTLKLSARLVTLEPAWCGASGFAIEPGQAAQISVEDTGEGMSPDVRERIFEPFFTTKPVGRGTGLGLSAVHGTIASHHGAIECNSELGRGTVFHLYLPVTTSSASLRVVRADDGTRAAPSVSSQRRLVWIVDDDELTSRAVAGLVAQLGYPCERITPQRALAEVESRTELAAVLCDVVMPGFDGPTLLREIANCRPDVALLLMTGFAPEGALSQLPAGMHVPVLRKPFGGAELRAALVEALSNARVNASQTA